MGWFRVDGNSSFHAKVLAAGNAAWGAFMRMGAYSTDNNTDGRITREVAASIASRSELARLVQTGLLESHDGGYFMHDFHDYNPSAEAAIAALAERKAKRSSAGKLGAAKRWQTDGKCHPELMASAMANAITDRWQTNGPDPDPETERDQDPPGVPPSGAIADENPDWGLSRESGIRPTADPLGGSFVAAAWADGIAAARGGKCSLPDGGNLRALLGAVETHGPKSVGERVLWIRREAEAFARSKPGVVNAFGFRDWLDAGRPAPTGTRKTVSVQPVPDDAPWMRPDYDPATRAGGGRQ